MRNRIAKLMPLVLAGALQVAPFLRTVLLTEGRAIAPSTWAIILRLTTGAIGLLGFDAISSASSIAISPVNATNGVAYTGTITYSGGHAGSVSSMKYNGTCLTSGASTSFVGGLTIKYNGVNTALVSGTPNTTGTFNFSITMYDGSSCSGLNDTRSTSLIISPTPVTNFAPTIVAAPQSLVSQVGSSALFSTGATGNPTPAYYWYQGLINPANLLGSGSSFNRSSVQLSHAGLYSVVASNFYSGAGHTDQSTAYLTVCQTPGSNALALHYTNYWLASNALTLTSYMTNVPAASNTYKWQYNYGDNFGAASTSASNLTLAANSIYAGHSGIYSIVFNSVVSGTTIVSNQVYDSYWAIGVPAVITSQPQGTNVNAGTTVTLNVSATVQQNAYGNGLPQGYIWYKNGSPVFSQNITGTNVNTSLTLNNTSTTDSGTYTVVVTNYWGTTTSSQAVVNVINPTPSITSQPNSASALVGQNAGFNVGATGAGTLTYQWVKDSSPLSDGGVYSGTGTSALRLTSVTAGQAGSYWATVSYNGAATNSNPAILSVSSPPSVNFSGGTLSGTTYPGLTYIVQQASDLTPPVQWSPIVTNTVDQSGTLSYTNTPSGSQQFLRLQFP